MRALTLRDYRPLSVFDENVPFFDTFFEYEKDRNPFEWEEKKKEYRLKGKVNGFRKNELDVEVNENYVTVRGRKDRENDEREYHGSFYRRFSLPEGALPEKAKAELKKNSLVVTFPKSRDYQKKQKFRKVKVE